MTNTEKIIRAFYMGFMCSREGFNAECAFEHCCDGLCPEYRKTESEFIEMMGENSAFQECLSEALERLNATNE